MATAATAATTVAELVVQRRWTPQPSAVVADRPERLAASLWRVDRMRDTGLTTLDLSRHHNIAMLLSGQAACDFRLGDGRQCSSHFTPQMFALTGVGERPEAYVRDASGAVLDIFVPETALARVIAEDLAIGGDIPRRAALVGRDPALHRVALLLAEEGRQPDAFNGLMLDALTIQLCVHLVRRWFDRDRPVKPIAKGGLAAWQLRKVEDYLHDRMAEDVALDDLAALARLSRFHFARAFRQSTGLPPHRYHRQLRMEVARHHLADRRLPIAEVAALVGYDSSQALARAFRRAYGISPARYRRDTA